MPLPARSLEYFLVLAEELHFRRAATRLAVSQPALTMGIKTLERQVGCELFDRGHGVRLTTAGEAFKGPAKLALSNQSLAERSAARAVATARMAGKT
jgi:DNA-binding transcriptional LysR family regulator